MVKKVGREALKEPFLRMINDSIRDQFESIRLKVAKTIVDLIHLVGESWVAEKIFHELER